jgi:fucose 4-O-acetylase-like acetyltransferase
MLSASSPCSSIRLSAARTMIEMTTMAAGARFTARHRDRGGSGRRRRWPAYAIAVWVGLFVAVVTVMWTVSHVLLGNSVDATARIIIGATALRAVTIGIALASVQRWGARIPGRLLVTGLWGAASAQLIYPLAELIAKLLILVGAIELSAKGISDMSLTGWFNLGAVWLVFGVPGALFVLAGRDAQCERGTGGRWAVIGAVAGVLFLGAIGAAIG